MSALDRAKEVLKRANQAYSSASPTYPLRALEAQHLTALIAEHEPVPDAEVADAALALRINSLGREAALLERLSRERARQSAAIATARGDVWQPRIGEQVKPSEHMLSKFGEWRGAKLWVIGVSMDGVTNGLNVTVVDEWPWEPRRSGGTDGFWINQPYSPDDLVPVNPAMLDLLDQHLPAAAQPASEGE